MLKQNIIVGIVFQGLLLLLSLIATRFVFRELGAEILGIISFCLALTALFITLSDMGLSVFIAREVAAYRHRDALYVEELVGGGDYHLVGDVPDFLDTGYNTFILAG